MRFKADEIVSVLTNEIKQFSRHLEASEVGRVLEVNTDLASAGFRLRRARLSAGLATDDLIPDLDISGLVDFHRRQDTLATVTAVQPPGRYGALELHGDRITGFHEKPHGD